MNSYGDKITDGRVKLIKQLGFDSENKNYQDVCFALDDLQLSICVLLDLTKDDSKEKRTAIVEYLTVFLELSSKT